MFNHRIALVVLITAALFSLAAMAGQQQAETTPSAQFDPLDLAYPIYLEKDGAIYSIMIDGSDLKKVSDGSQPAVSPDRSLMVFYNDSYICSYNSASGEIKQLVEAKQASDIAWDDMSKWVFYKDKIDDNPPQLMQMNVATVSKTSVDQTMVVSRMHMPLPKTGLSAYTCFDTTAPQSLRVRSGSGPMKTVVRASDIAARGDCAPEDFKGFDPYFTPDEHGIIFRGLCSGTGEPSGPIYFVSRNGSGLKRLTSAAFANLAVSLSPSERWLVYFDYDLASNSYVIYRLDLQDLSAAPVVLTQGKNPSW